MAYQLQGGVDFNTQISFFGGGHRLLNPLLTHVMEEELQGYDLAGELAKLALSPKTVYSPTERFSSAGEFGDLKEIPESGIAPDVHVSKGRDKGYQFHTWGGKIVYTRLLTEWLQTSRELANIPSDTTGIGYLRHIKESSTGLVRAGIRKLLELGASLYTKGFSATQINGPAGTGEDGEALFSIHHPYKDGTAEYANCGMKVSGNIIHPELSEDSLLHAIKMLKGTAIDGVQGPVLQNGMKIDNVDGVYDLIIPIELEAEAGRILNVTGDWIPYTFDGKTSGANGNTNTTNVFSWRGYKVRVIPMSIFGWTNEDGTAVGTTTNWFVRNTRFIRETKSLQMANLNGSGFGLKTWIDNNTDNANMKIIGDYAFEFSRVASLGLWGSKGDNTTIA